MSSPDSLDLRCEISSFEEPIRGRIGDERRSLAFRGWIELAAALTSLVEDAKRQQSQTPEEGNPHE